MARKVSATKKPAALKKAEAKPDAPKKAAPKKTAAKADAPKKSAVGKPAQTPTPAPQTKAPALTVGIFRSAVMALLPVIKAAESWASKFSGLTLRGDSISGTSGLMTVIRKLPISVTEAVTIEGAALLNYLTTIKDEDAEVRLTVRRGGMDLEIPDVGASATFGEMSGVIVPEFDADKITWCPIADVTTWLTALFNCSLTCGKAKMGMVSTLSSVSLDLKGRAYSTDRIRVSRYDAGQGLGEMVILPVEIIRQLNKRVEGGLDFTLLGAVADDFTQSRRIAFRLNGGDEYLIAALIPGPFFDCEKILAQREKRAGGDEIIICDKFREALKRQAKAQSSTTAAEEASVVVELKDNVAIIKAGTTASTFRDRIMLASSVKEPVTFTINPLMLAGIKRNSLKVLVERDADGKVTSSAVLFTGKGHCILVAGNG